MLYGSIAFFVLAAMLGVYMVTFLFRDREIPKGIAFIHGPLAIVGLVLLLVYAFESQKEDDHLISIILFVVAAIGGFIMLGRDLLRKPVPKWLAVVHALAAVAALVLIIVREGIIG